MANLANALKEEISRLARKEIRQQTAETAKSAAKCERDIVALKRQIEDLQRKLSSPRTQDAPTQTASKTKASKKTAPKKQDASAASAASAGGDASASGKQSSRARFSAKGLKANRERLGLSADNYGRLIGVSGLSIYNWEQEKARPRESSIAALMTIRGIGKREAAKRLEALTESAPAAPAPKPKAKAEAKESQSAGNSKPASEGQAKSES